MEAASAEQGLEVLQASAGPAHLDIAMPVSMAIISSKGASHK
jgi:hypothetical protein